MIHAHDQFVRTALSNPRVARDFFAAHLPKEMRGLINLENLTLESRSYVDDVRKESIVDVLYKTHILDKEAYLYLLVEHQSTPDELMPFRLLKYMCNIMDHHIKKTKKKLLPLVYPMVIYHAERSYPYTTNINDIVDAPQFLVEKYFLKPFYLIDLGKIEDEKLKQHAWAGVMEFALKHIFARDILPYLQDIASIMRRIDQSGGRDYIGVVLQYILEKAELRDKEAFFELVNKQISSEMGGSTMTLAEQLRAEGRMEGKMESQREFAERLFAENFEIALIEKLTGLPAAKLKEMQKAH